jgi:hypothetical protein
MSDNIMKAIHQQALQFIQQNDWDAAHRLVQDYSDPLSCQIHGYLHRIEGDLSNARYWYKRAGVEMPDTSMEQELKHLLARMADFTD